MSIDALIQAGRDAAECLMTDECVIEEVIGESLDPVTLKVTPQKNLIYSGICKRQQSVARPIEKQSGPALYVKQHSELHVPAGVLGLKVNQTITITASEFEASSVSLVYRITEVLHKSMATATRLTVEEVL